MEPESFFTKNTKAALKHDPPGEWMPPVPDHSIPLNAGYPAHSLVPYEEMNEAVKDLIEEEKVKYPLGSNDIMACVFGFFN